MGSFLQVHLRKLSADADRSSTSSFSALGITRKLPPQPPSKSSNSHLLLPITTLSRTVLRLLVRRCKWLTLVFRPSPADLIFHPMMVNRFDFFEKSGSRSQTCFSAIIYLVIADPPCTCCSGAGVGEYRDGTHSPSDEVVLVRRKLVP